MYQVAFAVTWAFAQFTDASPGQPAPGGSDYVGNEACAQCHAATYKSFKQSPMARASGSAADAQPNGEVSLSRNGVTYKISSEEGRLWLNFVRPSDPSVHGRRELLYYIGSGRRGRTYLFSQDGFLFESPINWYGDKAVWDLAPGYRNAEEAPMDLPALPGCLHCHVSGMRAPIAATENKYESPPFAFAGVTCERCHGPGASHVRGGPAVVPTKLPAERRDAICMQCHLEGSVAIEQPGRHIYQFRPGDLLSDYVHYYVADVPGEGRRALSQFEALSESGCKKKAGDAMSCTSCHDPHSTPAKADRAQFYRGKCLACHGQSFAQKHHTSQPDCTTCHMPRLQSTDVAHTQVTDHSIPRRPGTASPDAVPRNGAIKLTRFPPAKTGDSDSRSVALAWESLVEAGIQDALAHAEPAIQTALLSAPDDPSLLSALAYLKQQKQKMTAAEELYRKALSVDPTSIDAATNLGVIYATTGRLRDAVPLWQDAFRRAPGRSIIGLNLARAFCQSGQTQQARDYALRVLQFNPDMLKGRRLLAGLNATPANCGQ